VASIHWRSDGRDQTDAEYFEISKVEDYDVLMEHCRRGFVAAAGRGSSARSPYLIGEGNLAIRAIISPPRSSRTEGSLDFRSTRRCR